MMLNDAKTNRGIVIFAGLMAVSFVALLLLPPPLPRDQGYHDFADRRILLGVPNFWNVVSNIPFIVIGALGLRQSRRDPATNGRTAASTLRSRRRTVVDAHTMANRDDRKGLDIEGKTTLTCRNASEAKQRLGDHHRVGDQWARCRKLSSARRPSGDSARKETASRRRLYVRNHPLSWRDNHLSAGRQRPRNDAKVRVQGNGPVRGINDRQPQMSRGRLFRR